MRCRFHHRSAKKSRAKTEAGTAASVYILKGASYNRGQSKQDYQTPADFMEAFSERFGDPEFDLAADNDNAKAKKFFGKETDSLKQEWDASIFSWLNPPFDNIAPFAKKCSQHGGKIALLVPASVGSNWFRDFVHGKCLVLFLNGRLSFIDGEPYPKDCILCLYGFGTGFEVWSWKQGKESFTF